MSNNQEYFLPKNPVFVLGTQRAGTTLLTRALSAHPEMFIQNEIGVQDVFQGNPDRQKITHNLIDRLSYIIEEDFENYAAKNQLKAWGIKDPEFTDYIPYLETFIPESKFIIIVRDCRAVVNSYIDNKWGLGTTPYTGAERWSREVMMQRDFMLKYPDNFLLIKYEDLVLNFEEELKKVCAHIGLAFSDEMINYNKKNADFEINRQNVNTNKAPDKAHIEKWRKFFSSEDVENIEFVAGDAMDIFGYKRETAGQAPNPLKKTYYKLHQKIVGEIQIQYQWRKATLEDKKRQRARASS